MTIEINEDVAKKVLATVDAGLSKGLGSPILGQMCVEAAVTYALGEEFGDEPSCVDTVLRSFKIRLNDSNWSSKETRASGMRRLALAQLGSKDNLDMKAFVSGLVELAKKWAAEAKSTAAADAAATAAATAARYAADAAGNAARYAAAADAAAYTAYIAADAAAYAADAADARDKFLASAAEDVVQLLIKLNAPGVQWLYLTPL